MFLWYYTKWDAFMRSQLTLQAIVAYDENCTFFSVYWDVSLKGAAWCSEKFFIKMACVHKKSNSSHLLQRMLESSSKGFNFILETTQFYIDRLNCLNKALNFVKSTTSGKWVPVMILNLAEIIVKRWFWKGVR